MRHKQSQPETGPTIEPDAVGQERPYYRLTTTDAEIAEGTRLDKELADAKAVLAALEAQRATVDESLAVLAEEAEFRRQRREELAAQRDEAATRADLDAVATATTMIDATERVDVAREAIAVKRRTALADLDTKIEAAQEAADAAEAKVAAHWDATAGAGRFPRTLADHFTAAAAKALIAKFENDPEADAVSLVTAIADLPDALAEAVSKDPAGFIAIWRADHAPAVPEPKKRLSFEEAKQMLEDARAALREYALEENRRQQAAREQGPYRGEMGWGEIGSPDQQMEVR